MKILQLFFLCMMMPFYMMVSVEGIFNCQLVMRGLPQYEIVFMVYGIDNHLAQAKDTDEILIPDVADIILSSHHSCQVNCKTAGPAIPRA